MPKQDPQTSVVPNDSVIFSNATIAASGSQVLSNLGAGPSSLVVNLSGNTTGSTPTIVFTIQEVDPGDLTTGIGPILSTQTFTGTGAQVITLNQTSTGAIKITWTLGGTSNPSFKGAYVTLTNRGLDAITQVDGQKATYSASIAGLASAATATDLFTISGSASKKIRIVRLEIVGTQTTAGMVNVLLLKRSTLNTGGTFTNPTKTPHDSNDAAATATVNAYTVNPTALGALIGTIRNLRIFVPAATAQAQLSVEDFGNRPGAKSIVLNNANEMFAVNLNSTTVSGGSFNLSIEWTEE